MRVRDMKLFADLWAEKEARFKWGPYRAKESDGRTYHVSVWIKSEDRMIGELKTTGNEFKISIQPGIEYIFRIEVDGEAKELTFYGGERYFIWENYP